MLVHILISLSVDKIKFYMIIEFVLFVTVQSRKWIGSSLVRESVSCFSTLCPAVPGPLPGRFKEYATHLLESFNFIVKAVN